MHFDPRLGKPKNGYRHIRLQRRFQRLLDLKIGNYRCRAATTTELVELESKFRPQIPGIAPLQVLLDLRVHNSSIFQIVEDATTGRMVGFNAQLPLTQSGTEALTSGSFSTSKPLVEHVASPDEQVDAIYVWLTYSPRSFVATVAGLSQYVGRVAPTGCSLFCTPIDEEVSSFLIRCGYEPAITTMPGSPKNLLVAHPIVKNARARGPSDGAQGPSIEVSLVRTLHDMAQVVAIRASTFMHEQECPFGEEFDGNDFCASHIIGSIDGEPAGCIRIRYFADFVKFERLAVRREFRKSKLAFRLVREAMRLAAHKGYQRVYGHARHDLIKFWMTFGFRPIPGRPKFTFSDLEYVEMEGFIRPEANRVAIGDNPLRIIRPEGQWDEPGVLERTADRKRQDRIGASLRQLRAAG